MCGLCQLQHVFGDPLNAHDPLDAVRARAARLKRLVSLHEKAARNLDEVGLPPCDDSGERLKAYKTEQFELARQL